MQDPFFYVPLTGAGEELIQEGFITSLLEEDVNVASPLVLESSLIDPCLLLFLSSYGRNMNSLLVTKAILFLEINLTDLGPYFMFKRKIGRKVLIKEIFEVDISPLGLDQRCFGVLLQEQIFKTHRKWKKKKSHKQE